jgi:AmiR/NasT family two-component response regulator
VSMHADVARPQLRILVAGEPAESLAQAAQALGGTVVTADDEPVDVALVGRAADDGAEHSLALISRLVERGACPVVVVAPGGDAAFLAATAELGVYASIGELDVTLLRTAIAVALARFAEHTDAKRTLAHRMLVECAKGILMERYGLDEPAALDMLERGTDGVNLDVVEGAKVVVNGHRLLPARPAAPARPRPRRRRITGGTVTALALAWVGAAQELSGAVVGALVA